MQTKIAMLKEIIKELILHQQEFIPSVELIRREVNFEPSGNYVLVGLRRAGKSYMLYQHIQQLLREGHDKTEILFINFEDERISDIKKEDLHLLLECYRELFPHRPYIFLDEIQNVDGWEHFARRLADEKYHVFITGSNAHMLSREIATALGGRYMMQEVHPFTFAEYLHYLDFSLQQHWDISPQRADVVRLFDDYFNYGGFAEAFPLVDKRQWLSSLYQKILFADIVVRKGIRGEQGLSMLVRKIADSLMHPISVKRLQNIVQDEGPKITRETVGNYLSFLRDAYLCFSISNFHDTVKERETLQKHYFHDNGLLTLFTLNANPKLLENIVALTLYHKWGCDLFYYKYNVEVDFYMPADNVAIQVAYDLNDAETKRREVTALATLNTFKPLDRALIITHHTEETIELGDLTVHVTPIWKWLLTQFCPK